MATGSAAVPARIAREASAPNQLKRFFSRYFYFSMALLMAGLAVWAFSDTVDAHLLHAKPPRPLPLWFHGTVFTAWIVLFIAQSAPSQPGLSLRSAGNNCSAVCCGSK